MPKLQYAKATEAGKKRFIQYAVGLAILAGLIIATLIVVGVMSKEQFDSWVLMVGVTVPALIGIVNSLLAMFNIEHDGVEVELPDVVE